MGRRAALTLLAAGLALAAAGCGKQSAAQQQASSVAKARASATSVGKPAAAPTDCTAAGGVGGHDAAFAVELISNIDYRNVRQLAAVVEPLLTPTFFGTYTTGLGKVEATVLADRAESAVAITTVTYAGGGCTTPSYTVAYTERTTTAKDGLQITNHTVKAAMTWNGATYLVANIT